MLVGERMSSPVISVPPDMPVIDALKLMQNERIRRTPIIKDGKLLGIVSDKDLINASPSPATTLSIWEMNYLLSKIKVSDVMTKKVLTVLENTPIEDAARIMADHKIGGLPVLRADQVVGIITETDLFKTFLELMGGREDGIRATAVVLDQPGQLAKLAGAIAELGGNIIAFGQLPRKDPSTRQVTLKITGLEQEQVRSAMDPLVEEVLDIRFSG